MSRRQRTVLTFSLRIPVPAGKTQEQAKLAVKQCLLEHLEGGFATHEILIKIVQRDVTYLN